MAIRVHRGGHGDNRAIFAILPERVVAWLIELGVETQLDFAFFFGSDEELQARTEHFQLDAGERHQVMSVWRLAGDIHEDRTLAISLAKLEKEMPQQGRPQR